MKKLFILILGVLFLIPLSVKADMGPPAIRTYKVTPKSSSGASYYDYDLKTKKGTIKSGEYVQVIGEKKSDGKVFAEFSSDDKYGYVDLSEFVRQGDEVNNDKASYVGKVFAKNGIEIYTGPSYSYDKTGKSISYNEDVNVSDFISDSTWIYVEKGDIKGYADASDGAVGIKLGEKILEISTGKEISGAYILDPWTQGYMIPSNNSLVKVDKWNYGYALYTENDAKALKSFDIYKKNEDFNSSNKVTTVPAGADVKVLYSSYGTPSNTYISYGDNKGWINCEVDYDVIDVTYKNTTNYLKADGNDDPTEVDDPTGDVPAPTPNNEEDKKLTTKQIVLLSIAGGVLVVLTSIVTIILVNKKKKTTVEE